MSEHLAVRGLIATTPRHIVSGDGLDIVSFRLVSASRRFDAESGSWKDDQTNWFTVSAFRKLAVNSASHEFRAKKKIRRLSSNRLSLRGIPRPLTQRIPPSSPLQLACLVAGTAGINCPERLAKRAFFALDWFLEWPNLSIK